MRYIKDTRSGTVLPVSDTIAKMVLKDPDIVEVSGPESEKPAAARKPAAK